MYDLTPRALVLCTHASPDDFIQMFVGSNAKPISPSCDKCNDYPWHSEGRGRVKLCAMNPINLRKVDRRFHYTVELVIIFAHPENSGATQTMECFLNYLYRCSPVNSVVAIEKWPDEKSKKEWLILWCEKNKFEIVNFNPEPEELIKHGDQGTKYGTERIKQILAKWENFHEYSDDEDLFLKRRMAVHSQQLLNKTFQYLLE